MCNPQALLSLYLFKSEEVNRSDVVRIPHMWKMHIYTQLNKTINQSLPRLELAVCAWSCGQAQ